VGLIRTKVFPPDGLNLEPAVDEVGPFPRRDFVQAWWEELSPDGELVLATSDQSALVLVESAGRIEFAGDSDLTDYHSPLGTDVASACTELAGYLRTGQQICLDSLPAEGAKMMHEGLAGIGLAPETVESDVAMVLELPATIDGFYQLIGKKERHELRRKRRRYESAVGTVVHRTFTGPGFGIEEFVRLHVRAGGRKGLFMTPPRSAFFNRLATQTGWRVDLLEKEGIATACMFGWVDARGYYLYNSSFEPDLQSASPGLVLLALMIEVAIDAGIRTFDFLKGDEGYKSRLGARPRQLYKVEAQV
jgi:CelD/BcsL family acetyltransferase involved in cellulose biosynthesis